jgi:hypothetical protein
MLGSAAGPVPAGAVPTALGGETASAAGDDVASNEGRGSLLEAVDSPDGSEGGGGRDAMVGLALAGDDGEASLQKLGQAAAGSGLGSGKPPIHDDARSGVAVLLLRKDR